MKSLREISLNRTTDQFTVWAKLPIIADNNVAGTMSSQDVLVSELKFGLVTLEMVYNQELEDLLAVVRRAAVKRFSPKDNIHLPKFNRRHLVMLVAKLKKYSDQIKHDIERDWTGEVSIALNLDRMYDYLDFSLNTSFTLSCVAYCEMLDELRAMLKRMMLKSSEDIPLAFSGRLSAERALLPIQRLSLHRSTLCRILGELPERTYEAIRCKTTLENVTGVLDRCYEVLDSLHGRHYTADIDNLLDFSSKLSSLKFRKQKTVQTVSFEDTTGRVRGDFTAIPSDKEALEYICNHPSREEDIMEAMRSEILAGRSLGNCGSMKSFNLIDLASDRDESVVSASSLSTLRNDHSNHDHNLTEEDMYELIEIPLNSSCMAMGSVNVSGNSLLLHKSLEEGPLYQAYVHNDLADIASNEVCSGAGRWLPGANPEEENIYEEIDDRRPESRGGQSANPARRTLWCQIEVVKNSGILRKLTPNVKALQEAKFEIITSEVSYLKSLCVLITLFYESPDIRNVLTNEEMEYIFANVAEVREVSERFLYDLAGHLEEDTMMADIASLVRHHAVSSFKVYIDYCTNQVGLHKKLQTIMSKNNEFKSLVNCIETSCPEVEGYTLASYLTLPTQRVTRLPLLMQAVQKRLQHSSKEFTTCQHALAALNQLVYNCNEGIRKKEQEIKNSDLLLRLRKC